MYGIIATSHINSSDLGWPVSFWFAVLSPVLGILTGFLALFLFFR